MRLLNNYLPSSRKASTGFTLIELLVVIAIIAILMGLLFPAGQNALNSAKKTTAKNQAVQIATAITAYEAEYGRLPSPDGYAVTNGSGANATTNILAQMGPSLVATLCTSSGNPRGIIFLDSSVWKAGKGGTNSSGFCDPFNSTNVYQVSLDMAYNNQIQVPTNSGINMSTTNMTTITKHIGVWSSPLVGKTNVLINSWD